MKKEVYFGVKTFEIYTYVFQKFMTNFYETMEF